MTKIRISRSKRKPWHCFKLRSISLSPLYLLSYWRNKYIRCLSGHWTAEAILNPAVTVWGNRDGICCRENEFFDSCSLEDKIQHFPRVKQSADTLSVGLLQCSIMINVFIANIFFCSFNSNFARINVQENSCAIPRQQYRNLWNVFVSKPLNWSLTVHPPGTWSYRPTLTHIV